jgi:hypothetical protein
VKRLLLVVLLCLAPACAPPKAVVTPQGQVAFTADQIIVRVGELQNAVLQANANKALDDATTKTVVTWTTAAARILKTTPSGWQATLFSGWKAVKPQIPTNNPAIALAVGAVDALVGGLS